MYFVAAILAFKIAITFRATCHKYLAYLYMAAALAIFVVSMEEISWGQRILGIDSPEYFLSHNRQKELNLHNLDSVQTGPTFRVSISIFIGIVIFYLSFAWLFVPKRLTYAIAENVHYVVPSWHLTSYFLSPPLWWLCAECNRLGGPPIWQTQEAAEFVFALGCLLFMVLGAWRLRLMRPQE
jgi:hypothetical protein